MQTIYQPANQIEAQLVVDLLESEGIHAIISGSFLTGAIGDLPAGGLVRIMVDDDDAERAREIMDGSVFEENSPKRAATSLPASGPSSWLAKVVLALVAGGAIGYGIAFWHYRLPFESDRLDFDHNGIVDSVNQYQGELLVRILDDRNEDGKTDQITDDPYGGDARMQMDDNFDGRFESRAKFHRNVITDIEYDVDGDGFYEQRQSFANGIFQETVYYDPRNGAPIKRQLFTDGILSEDFLDSDRDGSLETHRKYDALGEIVATH
jgi:hypothetical protein